LSPEQAGAADAAAVAATPPVGAPADTGASLFDAA